MKNGASRFPADSDPESPSRFTSEVLSLCRVLRVTPTTERQEEQLEFSGRPLQKKAAENSAANPIAFYLHPEDVPLYFLFLWQKCPSYA